MKHIDWRHIGAAIATLAVAGIGLLWAWNTLAGLFGGPTMEFKHVLAGLVLLALTRFVLSPRQARRHRHG